MAQDLVRPRALGDLARSGLTAQHAKLLKITPVTAAETKRLTGYDTPAYRIPYFTPTGRATPYYRLRLLDPPQKFSKPGKDLKYWQAPGSGVRLYFPPTYNAWDEVLDDPEQVIYITEGEKKAARAGVDGIPTLGLGGVWSWRSSKKGVALIDDFKLIEWRGRRVVIVFDSDVAEKVDVQRALLALSRELVRLGALPETLALPAAPGTKVGLDDFLEAKGERAFHGLPREQLMGGLGEALWQLNDELAYVEEPGAVCQLSSMQLIGHTQLTKLAYAHRNTTIFVDAKPKSVNVAEEWLRWAFRRTHKRLTYAPGQPRETSDGCLNTWAGWGVEPKKGDVTPWAELLEFLFKNDKPHLKWFLQWLAYPLRHPGAKLYSACVFFSLAEGMGKSLVGMTMGQIYGKNFSMISQRELHSSFNSWAVGKQFVMGDDVTGSDKREDADTLKFMISREQLYVNKKFQPEYVVPDVVNYLFTANHPDAFFLGNYDRRYYILEIEGTPLTKAFYAKYDEWLRGDGPSHLFHHLLHNVDLTGFNPKDHAPVTDAKRAMIELSHGDLDAWAQQLAQDPDGALRIDGKVIARALWTIGELRTVFDPANERKTTFVALSKALRRAGFRPLEPTTTRGGTKKLWAIRDRDRWRTASHDERAREYERSTGAASAEPKRAKF